MNDDQELQPNGDLEPNIEIQMERALTKAYGPTIARQTLACLGGLPFVGGLMSGAAFFAIWKS